MEETTNKARFVDAFIPIATAWKMRSVNESVHAYYMSISDLPIKAVIEYLFFVSTSPESKMESFPYPTQFSRDVRAYLYHKSEPQHYGEDPCDGCQCGKDFKGCKNMDLTHGTPKCKTPGARAARIEFLKTISSLSGSVRSRHFLSVGDAMHLEFITKPLREIERHESRFDVNNEGK